MRKFKRISESTFAHKFELYMMIRDHHGNAIKIRQPIIAHYSKMYNFLQSLEKPLVNLSIRTPLVELFNGLTKATRYFDNYEETRLAYNQLMSKHLAYKNKIISYS